MSAHVHINTKNIDLPTNTLNSTTHTHRNKYTPAIRLEVVLQLILQVLPATPLARGGFSRVKLDYVLHKRQKIILRERMRKNTNGMRKTSGLIQMIAT